MQRKFNLQACNRGGILYVDTLKRKQTALPNRTQIDLSTVLSGLWHSHLKINTVEPTTRDRSDLSVRQL